MSRLREYQTFITRAVRQPKTVGAVLPTSRAVASAVASVVPSTGAPTVVELGAGTGALSEGVRRRLPADGRHVAIEIDRELVDYLRSAKPWLRVIQGDAADLRELLDAEGIGQVDAIITSIPWTLLPAEKQRELLRVAAAALKPEGAFTTVTYLTTLWRSNTARFVQALHGCFDEVLPRSAVWCNVPPARIYVCRRPLL